MSICLCDYCKNQTGKYDYKACRIIACYDKIIGRALKCQEIRSHGKKPLDTYWAVCGAISELEDCFYFKKKSFKKIPKKKIGGCYMAEKAGPFIIGEV